MESICDTFVILWFYVISNKVFSPRKIILYRTVQYMDTKNSISHEERLSLIFSAGSLRGDTFLKLKARFRWIKWLPSSRRADCLWKYFDVGEDNRVIDARSLEITSWIAFSSYEHASCRLQFLCTNDSHRNRGGMQLTEWSCHLLRRFYNVANISWNSLLERDTRCYVQI